MSFHRFVHQGVRGLRELFGIPTVVCDRCSRSERSSGVGIPSGAVDQPVDGASNSILDVWKHEDVSKGWGSYKVHSEVAIDRGTNRSFFQYQPLPSSVIGYSGVTNAFNAYCQQMGVSCCVTMDPSDYQQLMHFKVVGQNDVVISHDSKTYVLAPGDTISLKSTRYDDARYMSVDNLPRISKMVNGNV